MECAPCSVWATCWFPSKIWDPAEMWTTPRVEARRMEHYYMEKWKDKVKQWEEKYMHVKTLLLTRAELVESTSQTGDNTLDSKCNWTCSRYAMKLVCMMWMPFLAYQNQALMWPTVVSEKNMLPVTWELSYYGKFCQQDFLHGKSLQLKGCMHLPVLWAGCSVCTFERGKERYCLSVPKYSQELDHTRIYTA